MALGAAILAGQSCPSCAHEPLPDSQPGARLVDRAPADAECLCSDAQPAICAGVSQSIFRECRSLALFVFPLDATNRALAVFLISLTPLTNGAVPEPQNLKAPCGSRRKWKPVEAFIFLAALFFRCTSVTNKNYSSPPSCRYLHPEKEISATRWRDSQRCGDSSHSFGPVRLSIQELGRTVLYETSNSALGV